MSTTRRSPGSRSGLRPGISSLRPRCRLWRSKLSATSSMTWSTSKRTRRYRERKGIARSSAKSSSNSSTGWVHNSAGSSGGRTRSSWRPSSSSKVHHLGHRLRRQWGRRVLIIKSTIRCHRVMEKNWTKRSWKRWEIYYHLNSLWKDQSHLRHLSQTSRSTCSTLWIAGIIQMRTTHIRLAWVKLRLGWKILQAEISQIRSRQAKDLICKQTLWQRPAMEHSRCSVHNSYPLQTLPSTKQDRRPPFSTLDSWKATTSSRRCWKYPRLKTMETKLKWLL